MNEQIDWIANNPNVKTVFLFHRNRLLGSATNQSDFESSAEKTFTKLLQANKHVIYVYSLPELNFDPRLCVGELPFGRSNPVNTCSYPLSREIEKQSRYRSSISTILKRYPTISTYDPAIFLCPNGVCSALIDNKVMFTDSNHLSESGSVMQGASIKKQIPLRQDHQ